MPKKPTRKGMRATRPPKAAVKPAAACKPHGTREGPHHVSLYRGGGR